MGDVAATRFISAYVLYVRVGSFSFRDSLYLLRKWGRVGFNKIQALFNMAKKRKLEVGNWELGTIPVDHVYQKSLLSVCRSPDDVVSLLKDLRMLCLK